MPRSYWKGGDRRTQIVTVARQLFAERGYDATTTRGIAHAAGVSDGLVYQYFATKRDLLLATLDDPAVHEFGVAMDRIASERHETSLAAWHMLVTTALTFLRQNSDLIQVLYREASIDHEVLTKFERTVLGRFRNAAIAIASSEAIDFDPPIVARAAFGILLNFVAIEHWLDSPDAPRYEDAVVVEQITRLLTRALHPVGETTPS